MAQTDEGLKKAWTRHERRWKENRYVYAVVSRRSGGVSVGINLNPDKACNFDCIYCQVDRTIPPAVRRVDLKLLAAELDRVLEAERDGSLYESPPFNVLTPERRGVRDVAFSGDGEPTTCPRFVDAVRIAADARQRFGLASTKLVLITDAAFLDRPSVRAGLELLDGNDGEIWAKLDAGTDEYFRRVCRPNVPFQRVLENLLATAIARPIVIQSLWMRIEDKGPDSAEVAAYCRRLNTILERGGRIRNIQIYTIARRPAELSVAMLPDEELDAIAATVRKNLPVPVETYYGVAGPADSTVGAESDPAPPGD